jgi:hypothetical protein
MIDRDQLAQTLQTPLISNTRVLQRIPSSNWHTLRISRGRPKSATMCEKGNTMLGTTLLLIAGSAITITVVLWSVLPVAETNPFYI